MQIIAYLCNLFCAFRKADSQRRVTLYTMKPFTEETALLWATGRCALRECCRQEIKKKWLAGGLDDSTCEHLLDRLEDEGFIDESRYARAFVHDKLEYDHWGRIKMTQALRLKGIRRSVIDEALAEKIDDEHYREVLRHILQQKFRTLNFDPDDREETYKAVQKLVRFAASRGFEPELIFQETDKLTE